VLKRAHYGCIISNPYGSLLRIWALSAAKLAKFGPQEQPGAES